MRTVASVARCLTLLAFSVNVDVYCAVSLGLSTADPETCDIRVSHAVPVARCEVEIRIRVHNHGDTRSPASEVSLRVVRDTGDVSLAKTVELPSIDGGKSAVLVVPWTPEQNGTYRVIAVVDPRRHLQESDKKRLHNMAAIDVPVVEKPLHFLFRHRRNCPRARYLNTLCFSGNEQERRYWEGRGMLLARHLSLRPPRERVPKRTPENIASYWAAPQARGYSAMVIDELGSDYGGPIDQVSNAALLRLKEIAPSLRSFVYIAGRMRKVFHKGFREAATFVMPEAYAVTHDGLEAGFRGIAEFAEKHGFRNKLLVAIGLARNRWAGTPAEVDYQVRCLRRAIPEMPGATLYGYFADDDLMLAADRACFRYFIMPCLLLEQRESRALLRNIGGMDARDVVVSHVQRSGLREHQRIARVPAGGAVQVVPRAGFARVEIEESRDYTVLDRRSVLSLLPRLGPLRVLKSNTIGLSDESLNVERDEAGGVKSAWISMPPHEGPHFNVDFTFRPLGFSRYATVRFGVAGSDGRTFLGLAFRHGDSERGLKGPRPILSFRPNEGFSIKRESGIGLPRGECFRGRVEFRRGRTIRCTVSSADGKCLWDTGHILIGDRNICPGRLQCHVNPLPDESRIAHDLNLDGLFMRSVNRRAKHYFDLLLTSVEMVLLR